MSKNEKAISPKTAVIYMDGDLMKVVFGRTVKELYSDRIVEEQAFFERLFKEYRVVVVEKASEVTLSQIVGMDEGKSGPVAHDKPVEKEPERPATKSARKPDKDGLWIRSTSRTTIIIDDLPTGTELAPGVPMTFSVPHDRAVSMASLDPESVQKSNILKRLLANGTLAWVTGTEAQQMEAEYVAKVAQENDDRLNQWAPIIDGSVDEYLKNPTVRLADRGEGPKDAPEVVEVSATEVSEMEEMASLVPESKPRPERTAPVLPNALAGNVSLNELMDEFDKADQGEGIRPPVERRKVTNTEVIPGASPRGISRR